MHPILLKTEFFTFYTYGLFIAIGFMTAVWFSKKNAKPHNIPPEAIQDVFFIILITALAGARILYVTINFDLYMKNPVEAFKIWNGGLVFFGGFILALPAAVIYLKIKEFPVWKTADIIIPGIALGHAVGRIGCLFAGCCYGKETDLPIAIKFTDPESLAPVGLYLHPTQVYSVISNLFLFFILLWLSKRKKFDGMIFLAYIMAYSSLRSLIEFFRGDFRGDFIFNFISMSQGIGLLCFAGAALIFIVNFRK